MTGCAVYEVLASYTHGAAPAGRAVFARGGEVVPDPPPVIRPPAPAASWSALPRAGPLLGLADEEPVCLLVYTDRRDADFELRTALGSRPAGQIHGEDGPVRRTASDDGSEGHFQWKAEHTGEQSARDTTGALSACQEGTPAGLSDEDVERSGQAHACKRAAPEPERFRAARAPDSRAAGGLRRGRRRTRGGGGRGARTAGGTPYRRAVSERARAVHRPRRRRVAALGRHDLGRGDPGPAGRRQHAGRGPADGLGALLRWSRPDGT
ncbi:baeRF2 domain-containing protein [Streptomyces sp. NPDC003016]